MSNEYRTHNNNQKTKRFRRMIIKMRSKVLSCDEMKAVLDHVFFDDVQLINSIKSILHTVAMF